MDSIADLSLYTSLEEKEPATLPMPESTPRDNYTEEPIEQAKAKPVAVDIETGGFPFKPTVLRRSASAESQGSSGVGSLGLLLRWMVGRPEPSIRGLGGREPSLGDSMLSSPGRKLCTPIKRNRLGFEQSTSTNTTSNTTTDFEDPGDDDGYSYGFLSDMSAMTFGSDFDILIDGSDEQRLGFNRKSRRRILQHVGFPSL